MLTFGEIFGRMFDVGLDILASTLDLKTGTLTAQLGDVTKDRADSDSAEMWFGAPGLAARPALPDQGKASCQAIVLKRSDHDLAIAYRDLRANDIYANLAPGEGCIYATSGMARHHVKADGSSRSYTTDSNTKSGNGVWCGVSSVYQGVDGQPHKGGEWRYYGPWGGAWHDPGGYHFRDHSGVKIDIGGLTFPAPIGATASTYALAADIVTVKCSSMVIGFTAAAQPLVKALALQILLEAYAADLATFTTAVAAFGTAVAAVPVVGGAAATMGAAATALGTATNLLMASVNLATGATAIAGS